MDSCKFNLKSSHTILDIDRSDRWEIRRRLAELSIPAHCDRKGNLLVEIQNGVEIVQVRSVIRRFNRSRTDLVHWLEHCWGQPFSAYPS